MGADLTVEGIEVPVFGFEVSERAGNAGYFRDCYNETGLFWNIGLDWWKLTRRYEMEGKIISDDERGCILRPEFVDEFSETVETAFRNSKVAKKKEYKGWMHVFRLFINTAKKAGKGIRFSV